MLFELHQSLKYFTIRPWTSFVTVVLSSHPEGCQALRPHCSFKTSLSVRPFVSAPLGTGLIAFRRSGNFLVSCNPSFTTVFVALYDALVVFGEGFLPPRATHNLRTTFCSQPATASRISKSWSRVSVFIQGVRKVAVNLQRVLEVMSTSVYTGLKPFNFIRKQFLQICLWDVSYVRTYCSF
jgi:hypothetical protein